ncbi:MAG TPA: ABC transporter permease [Candidatus Eisenbacteria bacterium]|jgi:putative ABC transport system permease protein
MLARLMLASLAARRARVGLAVVAVALGVAVTVALATLALQVGDDLARTLRAAGPNFVVLPAGATAGLDFGGAPIEPARAGLALPESTTAMLKSSFWKNNVLEAAPERVLSVEIEGARAPLSGTWFDREVATEDGPWRTGLEHLRPAWRIQGRWPSENAPELALGRDLAASLGLAPGARARIGFAARSEDWTVTGIVTAGGLEDRRAWAPLERVEALAEQQGVDRVWMSALVRAPSKKAAPDPARDPRGYERYSCTSYPANVARDLAEHLGGAEVLPMTEVVTGEGRVVERLNLLMLLLALAALAASVLGLLSTTTATVVERSVELGLLRALGASAEQIAVLLLGETVLISLLGGTLGFWLGSAAAAAIRGHTFGSASPMQPLLLPLALVLSLALAVLGTLAPLRLALRLDPATVLRG